MTIRAESEDLRIGVTSREGTSLSGMCEQFGRTYWLMIYSTHECTWYAIDNALNRTQANGAGVATAETLIDAGVTVVLTGETGPKAFRTLKAAGISVVHNVTGLVEDALCDWQAGRLKVANLANDSGSPSCLLGQYLNQGKVAGR